jgi:long-chain acyl-CoA synthetase
VNIYPAENRRRSGDRARHPRLRPVSIPDDEFGEALRAYIQPQDGTELTDEEVRSPLRRHLAGYKVPRLIKFVASLPRDDSGKIFKRRLRAPHWKNAGRQI